MGHKYSEYIYYNVKQSLGYSEDATGVEEEIDQMSRTEVLERVARWHNLIGGWADDIKRWIEDIYQIKLVD